MTGWPQRVARTARFIRATQLPSGAIPWFAGGKTDPWNHIEAAMALSIAGEPEHAEAAYFWLARTQLDNGAWFAEYNDAGTPQTRRIETNFVAYIASGVWHHGLVTDNDAFLADLWPTVQAALDYVLRLQAPSGEIYWAEDLGEGANKDALVTGCSSIYRSLQAGCEIASRLGKDGSRWAVARQRLGEALRNRPERFDRTWESKARFAMDWFYPVLCGVHSAAAGSAHLQARAAEFIEPDLGCRCVNDEPWVTVAETCELVMAYAAVGDLTTANRIFAQLERHQAEDGSWWTGWQYAESVYWPNERPTWTAGAVLLAWDALNEHTAASNFFSAAPNAAYDAAALSRVERA